MRESKETMIALIITLCLVLAVVTGIAFANRSQPQQLAENATAPKITSPIAATQPKATATVPAKADSQNEKEPAKPVAPRQTATDNNLPLTTILNNRGVTVSGHDLTIYVKKSDKYLSLFLDGKLLKTYPVELGDSGPGDKRVAGDHKTPEGTFYVTEKLQIQPSDEFLGTRWLRLSYPNAEAANRGLEQGLINRFTYDQITEAIANLGTPPQNSALGGGVGIHGGSRASLGSNWTYGCVGLTNQSIEEFYNYVKVGTPVVIES